MTHTPIPAPPAQTPTDRTRWTPQKAAAFLQTLAQTGEVAPAARAAGMSRQAAYRLRRRAPKFAELWQLASDEAKRLRAARDRRVSKVHPLFANEADLARLREPQERDDEGYTSELFG